MTQENQREDLERDQQFFSELEKVLDEQFPKVEEEGLEKQEMRRGAALVLFGEANVLHSQRLRQVAQRIWEMVDEMINEIYGSNEDESVKIEVLSVLQGKIKEEYKL